MKKHLFLLVMALITCVSTFASKDVVPSDAVLADYYSPGDVCVCIFVPDNMACNDIVLTGSFNGWNSTPSKCAAFESVEGYDGWYVASYEPEAEPDAEKGLQAKPVMLDDEGRFNWEYQAGAATVIRGGVQVVNGYVGEIDLINFGADAPNVFTIDAWKSNPCTAIYHNYTITVASDGCNGYVVPFVVGGMNNWSFTQMNLDVALSQQFQTPVYKYSFKAAEGTEYQIVSGLKGETGTITEQPGWNDASYLLKKVNGVWNRIPGDDGDNFVLGESSNVFFDVSSDSLCWARCLTEPLEYTILAVKLPSDCAPQSVEIIGGFDAWEGTSMELLESGWWFVELDAKASQFFKFRSAGSWDQELEIYDEVEDKWGPVVDKQFTFGQLWSDDTWKGTPCKWIELDLSDEYYRWSDCESGEKTEHVVVKAKFPTQCAPETGVEIIGDFNEMQGIKMTYDASSDYYIAEFEANENNYFKFRSAGSWNQQIQYYNDYNWSNFADGELVFGQSWTYIGQNVKMIEWDLSDVSYYRWSDCDKAGDSIQWSIKDGVLSIDGVGEMYNYTYDYYNRAPWYEKRYEIYSIEISEGITGIGNYAFYGCEYVSSITIPSSIEYIAYGAFNNCYNLYAIYANCGEYDRVYNLVYYNNSGYAGYVKYKPLPYTIYINADHGYVDKPQDVCSDMVLTAHPYDGYMFERWSDGNTDNPRAINLTQDTTFTAVFKQYIVTAKIGNWMYELNTIDKTATLIGKASSIDVYDNSVSEWNSLPSAYVAEASCPANALWNGLKNIKVYADQEYINYMLEFDPQSMPSHTSSDGLHIYLNADNSAETGGYWDLFAPKNAGDVDLVFEQVLWDDYGNVRPYYPAVAEWAGPLNGEGWYWNYLYNSTFDGGGQFVGNNIYEGKLKKSEIPWEDWSDKFTIGFAILQGWYNVGLLPQANSLDGELLGREYKLEVTFDPQDPYDVRGAFSVPSSVTYRREAYTVIAIGDAALAYCENMTSITVPSSVESIGNAAFYHCSKLDSVILPSNLEYIYDNSFSECYNISYYEGPLFAFEDLSKYNMETAIINNGYTDYLDDYWFGAYIEKIDVAAVETPDLDDYCFNGYRYLKELILPAKINSIGYMAVASCMELQQITIPASVEEIGQRAFEDCRSLASVTFAKGSRLEAIDDWAFYNCHELAQLTLPEGVTEIGKAAFYGCTYLKNVSLPASMREIGDNAFALCSKMEKMTVDAVVPPTIEAKTFEEVSREMPVYVPDESVETYKSHPLWGELNIMGYTEGIENTFAPQISGKFIRDGQLLIIRNGKIYDATGAQVK